MATVIEFDRVGKIYRKNWGGRSLRGKLIEWGRSLAPALASPIAPPGMFWAISDVSFSVNQGETIGLIGHNGAGKSTTLKLISGVTQPTFGRVRVVGRIGALLELGAGFHPELSGRDNIWLSGALMGMSKDELKSKFDAIVDFSGLETFLDMPIKHYSSGMFARLGFSVNIHNDPDILLIDEVLAVGDQAFQAKCFDRIATLQKAGTTICLVTHTMDIVRWMCQRAIWFSKGEIQADGPVEQVIGGYLHAVSAQEEHQLADETKPLTHRHGNYHIEIRRASLYNEMGLEKNVFETGDTLQIRFEYYKHLPINDLAFGIAIHRSDGIHISGPNTMFDNFDVQNISQSGSITYQIPELVLLDGLYFVTVAAHSRNGIKTYDYQEHICQFRILNTGQKTHERYGVLSLKGNWQHTN